MSKFLDKLFDFMWNAVCFLLAAAIILACNMRYVSANDIWRLDEH